MYTWQEEESAQPKGNGGVCGVQESMTLQCGLALARPDKHLGLAGGIQETTMNKLFPTALGLKVAIAISAGGVLVQHPLYTDPAPRAYGDITIAEADNQ